MQNEIDGNFHVLNYAKIKAVAVAATFVKGANPQEHEEIISCLFEAIAVLAEHGAGNIHN